MDISKLLTPDNPAGKPKKWTPDEDKLLIELRGKGMTWAEIAKRFSGRSPISCRLHYQNYLEKQVHWDEEQKNKLARLYTCHKEEMWRKVAREMGIPPRSAESMHWELGEEGMSERANAVVLQLRSSATGNNSPFSEESSPAPTSHDFTPANV